MLCLAHRLAAAVVVLGTLAVGCGRMQGDFAGDGLYKGRVLIYKHAGHCRQLRCRG